MSTTAQQSGSPYPTSAVPYMNLGGGLNTLKAPHAVDRNELTTLVNAWYAYGQALGKRPGSATLVAALPDGGHTVGMVAARFSDVSYLVVQSSLNNVYAAAVTATSWGSAIGTVTGGVLRGAQMYDPKTSKDTLFLVTGHDTPQMWQGPATTLVAVATGSSTAGFLPNKPGTSTPITPSLVATLGNNSHLFYSGEPTAPSAVYISDAFEPESFSTPAMQADPYGYTGGGGIFAPAVIGMNDGVDGGNITALQTLGFAMVIFKESAVYVMFQTQFLADVAWQVANVSASRGCLSPRSVIAFAQFIVFLSIDGVYITYGQPNEDVGKQKISGNVPSYFDSTRFGQPALIANRTTAVAVRHANRYIVWFDTGTGVPTVGVWFDFDVTADQGLPAAGEVDGMSVGGAVALCGPNDDGNFAWGSAASSYVGRFGVGFKDPGGATISVQIGLKADMFEDFFGAQAPLMNKVPFRCDLIVATLSQTAQQQLQFVGSFVTNFGAAMPPAANPSSIVVNPQAGTWGQNWGAFNWSSAQLTESGYAVLTLRPQASSIGYIMQMLISESSVYPWLILGVILELNARPVSF